MAEQPTEEVRTGVREPDPTSIDFAVSRLLKEDSPEDNPPLAEPEDTEEEVEASHEEEQVEDEAPEESEEEVSEEAEYEDEGEQEEEASDSEEEPQYYRVKIDGEELEVTLEELQSGYQRQQDYTRKTQALAEERKTYEGKMSELEQTQATLMQNAQVVNEMLNAELKQFESVDWAKLKADDPVGYVQKQLEMQEVQKKQYELREHVQSAYEQNQKAQMEERQRFVEMERKEALKQFPQWKDDAKRMDHQRRIVEYATSLGYSDQELQSIVATRDLLVLDKARQWDEYQKTKQQVTQKKSAPSVRKVVKSKGKPSESTSRKKVVSERRERLRKSGSLRDAAQLMAEMQASKAIRK